MARSRKSSPKPKKPSPRCLCGYPASKGCICGCNTDSPEPSPIAIPFDDDLHFDTANEDSSWAFESFFDHLGETS